MGAGGTLNPEPRAVIDATPQAPRLLNRYCQDLVVRHDDQHTVKSSVGWVRRVLCFHHLHHPWEMQQEEINAFPTHLTEKEQLSGFSENGAPGVLLLLYRTVPGGEDGVWRA